MTITWNISDLNRRTSDGFVTTAHWQCTGTDGDHSASVYASCGWDGEPKVSFDNLTMADVLAWVWESVDKEATEAAVAAQIEAAKNPVSANGVPW